MFKDIPLNANSTLPALTHKLDQLKLEQIAIKTGLIERITRKFSAEGFLLSLLQAVCSGQGSLTQLAQKLSQIQCAGLLKQAVDYRFKKNNQAALLFMKEVSKQLAELQHPSLAGKHFQRVLLQDSTQIRLPVQNAKHYKGIANQWGEKSSAKIDVIKDALSGELLHTAATNGTHQDKDLANDLYSLLRPLDLVLRDMGYFSTAGLQTIDSKGAFYASRVPANTSVSLLNGSSLEKHLKSVSKDCHIVDIEVDVSKTKSLRTRLVAIRCPEEIANLRRAKAKAHRKKMGSKKQMYGLEREGWTIYITNLAREEFSAQEIHEIYSQRWGIEIQFRALKGQTHLRKLLEKRVKHRVHLDIFMQAIMILAQLMGRVYGTLKRSLKKSLGAQLSIELIASWLSSAVLKLSTFKQAIYYDIRHLIHGKKSNTKHLSSMGISLF